MHIAAGAGFFSNFALWNEAGYFDNSSETKPLLHLWSLGIEEQFYIVWPLLLWVAWKKKFNLLTITILVLAISFYLNVKGIKKDAVATFYSPQTRFWELLCGSVLAWVTLYKKDSCSTFRTKLDGYLASIVYREKPVVDGNALSNVISFIGMSLLVYGFWKITKEARFPGTKALLPVLGTVLIIAAGPTAWINRTILSNKIAVWFGLISFPLYLWHWPLLSFARIVEGEVPSRNIRIAAVVLSIALAWLTYKLVERPIRFGGRSKHKVSVLVLLMFIVGSVGYATYTNDGFDFRAYHQELTSNSKSYTDSIRVTERSAECFEIPYAYRKPEEWFCNLGKIDAAVKYFAYGDSHALSMVPALEKLAVEKNINIQFTGTSGCPSLLGIQSMRGEQNIDKYNCSELNERIFNHIKDSKIKNVLLINRWLYYTDSLSRPSEWNPIARDINMPVSRESSTKDLIWAVQNTVLRYSSIGVNVIFIEDNPQQTWDPKDALRKVGAIENRILKLSVKLEEHVNNQRPINEVIRNSGAKSISFDEILCNGKICPLVDNSKFLYSDDDHLSVEGSLRIYPILLKELTN